MNEGRQDAAPTEMCGILAVVRKDRNEIARDLLERLTRLVEHRGPDGEGIWLGEGVGLGHRRLAILDTSDRGRQPMVYSGEGTGQSGACDCVISYNGEVFNYRELRAELEGEGFRFSTGTDTEVILAAYRHWGQDCVRRFNGMWAFALYDRERRIIFCSRDRFGIKPLYYHQTEDSLFLSSEIRQLLPLLKNRRVNETVLFEYLVAGFLEHRDETFFQGIQRLSGGHNLVHDLESNSTSIERWYRLGEGDRETRRDLERSVAEVRELLESSISLRLRSDVRVGTCLSGGIDSSSIASLAGARYREATGERLIAIHATGGNRESDESEFARQVAKERDLELHLVEPRYEDFAEAIDRVAASQEEPFGSASIYMQYFVMRKAREVGCPVMLDGQGGDEVFLGYEKYFPARFKDEMTRNPLRALAEVGLAMRNNAGMSVKGTARYTLGAFLGDARYRAHRREMPFLRFEDQTGVPLLGEIARSYRNPFAIQRLEIERSNLPVLLRYEDKNSMAHSVEARVPFLDYRLVELAVALPIDQKIREGWAKYVLRKAVEDIVPARNLWRREKFGFNAPQAEWMGRHREKALAEIGDSRILRERCDIDAVMTHFDHMGERARWRVYNTAVWERIFGVEVAG